MTFAKVTIADGRIATAINLDRVWRLTREPTGKATMIHVIDAPNIVVVETPEQILGQLDETN